jgi:hypothetical protein
MSQIVSLNTASTLTMSSREIAKLTGKRHDNVMRDATNMLVELYGVRDALKFEHIYLDTMNRRQTELRLPKRETLILVAGYSVELRARIVDRWMELKAQQVTPITAFPKIIFSAKSSLIKGLPLRHSPVVMLLKIMNFDKLTKAPCRSLTASFWPERIASTPPHGPSKCLSSSPLSATTSKSLTASRMLSISSPTVMSSLGAGRNGFSHRLVSGGIGSSKSATAAAR